MNEQPKTEAPKPAPNDAQSLQEIEKHLKSIRGMLQFFTFILIMYIVFSIFGFIMSF